MLYRSLCVLCLCVFLGACVEQKKTPEQFMEQAQVIQSTPLTLQKIADIEKIVALHVSKNGKKDAAMEAALSQTLKNAGYASTQSPSLAGYVILLTVVHQGNMSQAQAQAAAKQSSNATWKPVGAVDAENMGVGLVVDVHVAARKIVGGVRNSAPVVRTASVETVLSEAAGRMVVFAPGALQSDALASVQGLLVQRLGKALAAAL